jgi:hypothetical protein
MNIVSYIQLHWLDITTVVAYIIAIASIIVKLTPTPKDDAVLAKIIAFLSKYIALNK